MKRPASHKAFKHIRTSSGIHEYVHKKNGLGVLIYEDHSTPTVTFNVTYKVGSRNEAVGHTGATHLLEHLMFKGAKKYNKKSGKSIWSELQGIGAQINATTWMDRTHYFELLPSEHLDLAMDIEADRMRGAFIREEDRRSEMTVVRNEFERDENSPYSALDKEVWATAFREHPYHHTTIGWRDDIENMSIEKLREFYDTYYWPNNAVVVVVGDVGLRGALDKIDKHFGRIKPSPHEIPKMYTTEPAQQGERRVRVSRTGEQKIVGIYQKVPDARHKDIIPLMMLYSILGRGKTSRLYKKLVESGRAKSVGVFAHAFHDPGLFEVTATAKKSDDLKKIEKSIIREFESIKNKGVSEAELSTIKAIYRAGNTFERDGSYNLTMMLNEYIAVGDWTLYTKHNKQFEAVKPGDIKRVANEYLLEDTRTVGEFIPK